jgi:hypothetical protein
MNMSEIYTIQAFTTTSVLEIQHICSSTKANFGLGRATGYTINEVYTTVFINNV